MAPKRPASSTASGDPAASASDADAYPNPSSPSPPKNPNPDPSFPPGDVDDDAAASDTEPEADPDAEADAGDKGLGGRKLSLSPSKSDPKPTDPITDSDSDGRGDGDGEEPVDDDASFEGDAPLALSRPSRGAAVDSSIKPISSRSMDGSPLPARPSETRTKRPRSATAPALALASASEQRRPARLWSPEDELTILHALTTYRARTNSLPSSTSEVNTLHSRIRGRLSVKVTTTQLSDKIRRLKQKYAALASRAKSGKDQDFASLHDQTIYNLSKNIWASKGGTLTNSAAGESGNEEESGESEDPEDVREKHKSRKMRLSLVNGDGGNGEPVAGPAGRRNAYPYLWEAVEELAKEHPSGAAFQRALGAVEGSKAQVMEEKLRKFRVTEVRQLMRRMELMKETVKLVLDALERPE